MNCVYPCPLKTNVMFSCACLISRDLSACVGVKLAGTCHNFRSMRESLSLTAGVAGADDTGVLLYFSVTMESLNFTGDTTLEEDKGGSCHSVNGKKRARASTWRTAERVPCYDVVARWHYCSVRLTNTHSACSGCDLLPLAPRSLT